MDSLVLKGAELVDADASAAYEPWMLPLPETRRPPRTRPRDPPVAPSAARQAAFKARFRHWTECYRPDALQRRLRWCADAFADARHAHTSGGAVAPGHRLRQTPGREASELRQGAEAFVGGVAGESITVLPDGSVELTVPVREAEQPHVEVKFDRLSRWMTANDWPDRELHFVAVWGADDECAGRPWLSTYSPNTAKAYELFGGVCDAYAREEKKGWIVRRPPIAEVVASGPSEARRYRVRTLAPDERGERAAGDGARPGPVRQDPTPALIPETVPPTNAREKKNGTARLFANTSWPAEGTAGETWEGLPVAPNGMKRPGVLARLEWASAESMAHGAGIICAIALIVGLQALGATDDLETWFRQVPATTEAQRQQVHCWNGRFMPDRMIQMGRFAAAHAAQRVSFVVGDIFFTVVLQLAWRWLRSVQHLRREWAELLRIAERRRDRFGERDCGLFFLDICQDDLGWVAPCEQIAWIAWYSLPAVCAALGVRYSAEKREEQGQPSSTYVYMGVRYDLADARMRIAADKQSKWLDDIAPKWDGVKPGSLVDDKKLSGTVGFTVFLCKSMRKGRTMCDSGFSCMAARKGDMKPVSHQLMLDIAALTATVRVNAGVPMLVDPRWWHAGQLGIAGDASVSDTDGGYGGNVREFAFHGAWTAAQRRMLDISTLELYTVALLVVTAGAFAGLGGKRLVMRSDNEPTVVCVNKRGSTTPTMAAARRAVDAACEAYDIEVLMVHIKGKRNVIADALSRGDIDGARARLRQLTGREPQIVTLPGEWTGGPHMRALLRAARRWRPMGVRHGTAV